MTITEIRKLCADFSYRNEHFVIGHSKEFGKYLAINYKDIDNSGKLTRELNGLQMYLANSVDGVIKNIENQLEIEYLINKGFSKARAFSHVFKIPYSKDLEEVFNQ